MGTIAFLILRFIMNFNTPGYDWVVFCFLLSLDSLVLVRLVKFLKKQ